MSAISCDVLGELLGPERGVAFRSGRPRTAFVPVPEAPMDEHGEAEPSVNEVRRAGEPPDVETVANPELRQRRSDCKLGRRSRLAN